LSDLGLTHVALPVTGMERSLAFYRRYARMEVVHRRAGAAWISDRTRPFVLVLIEKERVERPLSPVAHLGVACESRQEVDRLAAAAREEGRLLLGPEDSGPPVGYWVFVSDPDGHTLELAYGQEVTLTVEEASETE